MEHHWYPMEEQNENMSNREHTGASSQPYPYVIPLSIVMAGVIIAGAIMYSNANKTSVPSGGAAAAGVQAPAKQPVAGNVSDEKLLEGDGTVLGNPDASVAVVEFADFQCPFCGRFFSDAGKQIIDTYIKTGKVKFVYRNFAFLGDESEWAAQAAECAGDQRKYWQYHDYLFTHQNGENQGAFSKDHLKEFAGHITGLDVATFGTCLDSDKYAEKVKKDTEVGRNVGVSGTPTTFVNGKLVSGAQPFSVFKPLIESALTIK